MKGKKQFSGLCGDCSPQQLQILSEFKAELVKMGITDPLYGDSYLLRFLRARNFDLPKTLQMWRAFIQWRKDNNVEAVLNMEFPEINAAKQYYEHGFFKTDKTGRPIYIERVGTLRLDKFEQLMSIDRFKSFCMQKYERLTHIILPGCTEAQGKPVEQILFIMDFKDWSTKHLNQRTLDLVKLMSRIGTDYYPETLGTMFIVNVPLVFYGVWNVVKFFLDEQTRQKIKIFGSKYRKELLEYVDEDNLPDFLGGKCTTANYGEFMTKEEGPWVSNPALLQVQKEAFEISSSSDGKLAIEDQADFSNRQYNQNELEISPLRGAVPIKSDSEWEDFDIANESVLIESTREFKIQVNCGFSYQP